jgi:ribosome-binding protein aMBF1 (putative translation factor)
MKHLRTARHRRLVEVIVEAREAAGLSQRTLAAKLKRSGSFVWKMESQEHRVDVLEFVDIARAVGVEPLELLRRVLEGR